MNKNCWEESEEYPNLRELEEYLYLEKILTMDEKTFEQILVPKFWFIKPGSFWIWKINVLRAMTNTYEVKYEKYIREAQHDEHEKVRQMAMWACKKLGLSV